MIAEIMQRLPNISEQEIKAKGWLDLQLVYCHCWIVKKSGDDLVFKQTD